jgi:hypothetical protein
MLDMIDSVPLEAHGALKYAPSGCLLMIDEMVAMQHNLPRSDLSLRMVTTVEEQPSVHSEPLHLSNILVWWTSCYDGSHLVMTYYSSSVDAARSMEFATDSVVRCVYIMYRPTYLKRQRLLLIQERNSSSIRALLHRCRNPKALKLTCSKYFVT